MSRRAWFNFSIFAGDNSWVAGVELATASEPPARRPRIWWRRPSGVDPSHPLRCNLLINLASYSGATLWPFESPPGAPTDEIGGRYSENCHVGHVVPEHVTISAISEGVRRYVLDRNTAEALWKKSEELVGESF